MQLIYETKFGKIINGDNIEVMKTLDDNTVDTCISDFPYDLSFMGKDWDKTGDFYQWCCDRAVQVYRILKPGGYTAIFGYPTKNHRMKCAFEDAGFDIVEEIDWIYGTGMPKSQSISKMFDKAAGETRKVLGLYLPPDGIHRSYEKFNETYNFGIGNSGTKRDSIKAKTLTTPASDLAKQWDGYNTNGLKPAHEPITIFQKPLEGTYIQNLEQWNVGAMNIEDCRVPFNNDADKDERAAKCNFTSASDNTRGFATDTSLYGNGISPLEQARELQNVSGRFPPNVLLDEYTSGLIDTQSGISKSSGGTGLSSHKNRMQQTHNAFNLETNATYINESLGGYGDVGGASRYFPIFKYCTKASSAERTLPNGERNPHVTIKPVDLIKWLIKLLTPKGGYTIDITAGSCTHAVACEELNRDFDYNLRWLDIELLNTDKDPYCNVGKMRVEDVVKKTKKRLF